MPKLRNQLSVNVTGGDTQLVPPNLKRVAIIISPPRTATVWVSFIGPAAVGVGLALRPNGHHLILDGDWVRDCLTDEIRAASDGVAEVIGVLEITT